MTQEQLRDVFNILKQRRENNKGKKINNSSLPAGSPMYYYCKSCDELVDTKPEGWFANPPPKLCAFCQQLYDGGMLLETGARYP